MPTGTAHAGPLLAPPITGKQRPLTQIGADSARKALAEAIVREAPNHPMPQSEIDARLREQQREQKAQWDAHRPVALPVAGVSMPFPLFSPGPSKAQRKRDSIINAGNLKRLRHMLVFARERMDSLCHADSLAGKPEQCRKLRAAASLDLPPSTHPDSGGTRE